MNAVRSGLGMRMKGTHRAVISLLFVHGRISEEDFAALNSGNPIERPHRPSRIEPMVSNRAHPGLSGAICYFTGNFDQNYTGPDVFPEVRRVQ